MLTYLSSAAAPVRRLEQNNPQKYVQQVLGPLYSALTNASGSQLYVGIWGNSDLNDISQWLQVRYRGQPVAVVRVT